MKAVMSVEVRRKKFLLTSTVQSFLVRSIRLWYVVILTLDVTS